MLASKYHAAVEGIEKTVDGFYNLDNAIQSDLKKAWLDDEKEALKSRGEKLRIYDIETKKSTR
jgi:hypothetical protein